MTEIDKLQYALQQFAGITPEEFALSTPYWKYKTYKKGEFYNLHRNICKDLGFVTSGVFRSYTVNEETGEEKNVFLYSSNGFVVSFKSFVNQIPCDYHTQALTDASIIYINILDLISLYQQSHQWETFGRLLAQEAFNVTMTRLEGFLFKSPEERYLDLVRQHPDIFNNVPLYHISSYLGIQGPSLSRIRKRISRQ
ncbi:Crp/Fnr family transcriptional regulator [Runella sp. MFBS21]|uniref:Crp/Fnr family transcriptional regulator n=1 Tax=Runella sp. MFBS21 TaxID=3034018 RepID=UPI0023F7E903|nr:Crp/Fnr family transcriptional regulator [Runella sp. MFBS21]MDF7817477.1 Crp/Fnr family transcriptional regulator [Runella sp. MFBS21]